MEGQSNDGRHCLHSELEINLAYWDLPRPLTKQNDACILLMEKKTFIGHGVYQIWYPKEVNYVFSK